MVAGSSPKLFVQKAKAVQFRQIKVSVDRENTRRLEEIDLFDSPIEPNWGAIREAIRRADDVDDLRRVWPSELLPAAFRLTERTRRCHR